MSESRKYVNETKEKLKGEMSSAKRKSLTTVLEKLELWAKMKEGDVDALMELSIRMGIALREDWERIKKETEQYDEEESR